MYTAPRQNQARPLGFFLNSGKTTDDEHFDVTMKTESSLRLTEIDRGKGEVQEEFKLRKEKDEDVKE